MFNIIKEWQVRRRICREQKLRERCVRYAGNGNLSFASAIYRFIIKGTYIDRDPQTKEVRESPFPNLVGIIHQDESPTK